MQEAHTDTRNADAALHVSAQDIPAEILGWDELVSRCMGNIQLAQRALGKFQQRMPQELTELENALELQDTEQIARIAHRLKGTSASISAKGLQQAAAEIEDLGHAGRMTELNAGFERLRNEWERYHRAVASSEIVQGV